MSRSTKGKRAGGEETKKVEWGGGLCANDEKMTYSLNTYEKSIVSSQHKQSEVFGALR
jgi:hypothetical protein